MEEDMSSVVGMKRIAAESNSDSSCTSYFVRPPPTKRGRAATNVSQTKMKGVVHQHNGHWGAQIYADQHRIWLGTFSSETEAAMAYDSAAIRLRSGESHRNFPWTQVSLEEPNFQALYSTEAVLQMIKDGSYQSRLLEFVRTRSGNHVETKDGLINLEFVRAQRNGGLVSRQLFQKELTPSDVGSLNRLVIPKKYAKKYFPSVSDAIQGDLENARQMGDVQLLFYDKMMRSWQFRYCYWSSSQSFVFTRGWTKFVKTNNLNAGDTITFYLCHFKEGPREPRQFCMIGVNRTQNQMNCSFLLDGNNANNRRSLVHGGYANNRNYDGGHAHYRQSNMPPHAEYYDLEAESQNVVPNYRYEYKQPQEEEEVDVKPQMTQIKLFGVLISQVMVCT